MTVTRPTGGDDLGNDAQRVADELHDGAMQEITLARLQLDLLGASLRHDPALAEQLDRIAEVLGDASVRLQDLMQALHGNPGVVQTSS
jgi:signal transduction histidine kinase